MCGYVGGQCIKCVLYFMVIVDLVWGCFQFGQKCIVECIGVKQFVQIVFFDQVIGVGSVFGMVVNCNLSVIVVSVCGVVNVDFVFLNG